MTGVGSVSAPSTGPSAAPTGHLRSLARGGLVNAVGGLGNGGLQLLLVIVVTNLFPVRDAGAFFALTSLFVVLTAAASLGVDAGLARMIPQHLRAGRPDLVSSLLRSAGLPVLVLTCALAGCGVAIALTLGPAAVGDVQGASTMLVCLCLALPVAVALDLAGAATRTFGTMVPTVVVDRLGRTGLQVGAVAAVGLAGGGVVALGLAWSLPFLVATPVALLVLRRHARRALGERRPAPRIGDHSPTTGVTDGRRAAARAFWSFTWPRGVARSLQIALIRVDVVLVAALAGPAEAAVYAAASRLLLVGSVGVASIQQALQPHLGRVAASGDTARMILLYRQATAWNVACSWPIFLVLAGAAPAVTELLGDGYSDAAVPLTVLALSMLFATFAGPVDMVVLMAGRSRWSMVNAAVALVTDVLLLLLLVPRFGIAGAAWAWAAAIVVRNLLPLVQVRRLLGTGPASRASIAAGGAAALLVGLPVAAVGAVTEHSALPTVLAAATGAVAYLAALWGLRGPLQLAAFRGMLSRGRGTSPDSEAVSTS